jgi:hypothetical protein
MAKSSNKKSTTSKQSQVKEPTLKSPAEVKKKYIPFGANKKILTAAGFRRLILEQEK